MTNECSISTLLGNFSGVICKVSSQDICHFIIFLVIYKSLLSFIYLFIGHTTGHVES